MSFLSRIDRSGGYAIKRSPAHFFRESIAKLRHKEQHPIGRSDRERSRNAPSASAATYYNLANYKSGKCMSVEGGGSTANGAKVAQWSANGGSEQGWDFVARFIDA